MTSFRRIDDADAERLLRGRPVDGRPGLDAVGAFVAAVADLGREAPVPTGALATLLAEGFDPHAAPVATAEPAAGTLRRLPAALRRPAARVAGLSLAVKVLAGTGVALAGVTTAAGTGVLPDRLQDGVGGALEVVTPFEFPASGGTAPDDAPRTTPADDDAPRPVDRGDDADPGAPGGVPSVVPAPPGVDAPAAEPGPSRPAPATTGPTAPGGGPPASTPTDRTPDDRRAPAPDGAPPQGGEPAGDGTTREDGTPAPDGTPQQAPAGATSGQSSPGMPVSQPVGATLLLG